MDALNLAGHHTVAGRGLERGVAQKGSVRGCHQRLGLFRQLVDKETAVGGVEFGGDVVQKQDGLFAASVAGDGVLAELQG